MGTYDQAIAVGQRALELARLEGRSACRRDALFLGRVSHA